MIRGFQPWLLGPCCTEHRLKLTTVEGAGGRATLLTSQWAESRKGGGARFHIVTRQVPDELIYLLKASPPKSCTIFGGHLRSKSQHPNLPVISTSLAPLRHCMVSCELPHLPVADSLSSPISLQEVHLSHSQINAQKMSTHLAGSQIKHKTGGPSSVTISTLTR